MVHSPFVDNCKKCYLLDHIDSLTNLESLILPNSGEVSIQVELCKHYDIWCKHSIVSCKLNPTVSPLRLTLVNYPKDFCFSNWRHFNLLSLSITLRSSFIYPYTHLSLTCNLMHCTYHLLKFNIKDVLSQDLTKLLLI